ncbi:sugar ABC transporter ATP-binding protein [Devosia sp. Root413D1]|uniref:ABC transporter ATP-binding protein n=1 Tax=unclassified Devosia TaxID=196773 RepID=UPI000700838D|nr:MULTISPECIES: sn-glycerol-3-phosphate ABC transporter ATP-binding protein UgpC [unclassified Devosia]KQU95934.1 sugar ABC transporter ATP-binding protein [Devosia sp. Root105]KQW78405.1 sugar ABC transporter ATP-binding protein [Devosia sp. Root413D1]
MATLSIKGVRKSFGAVEVLNNIDIEVEDGGFLVLLGPSGCGKSTLLAIIAGLEPSSGGDILIGDKNVNDVHPKDRNIAMVFQSYALYPTMPVRRNIGFGLEMRKVDAKEREAAVQRAAELLQIEHLLDRKPGQLSGGQRQRVAMGRAIVRNPDLFLFDEPLSNLDAKLRVEMRTEIKRLHDRLGTTTVYVTHDQVEALTLGTKVAVMKGGVIQQLADPETIYDRPANMFVAGFIGSPTMNFLTGMLEHGDGGLVLRHAAGSLALVGLEQDVAAFVGREVVAGIRPETLNAGQGAAGLQGIVDVVEPTGPDTMVIVSVGGQLLTARLGPKVRPKPGDTLNLSVDTAAINLFDPVTGNRI